MPPAPKLTRERIIDFNQLPAEIRLQIWRHTMQPRTVYLWDIRSTFNTSGESRRAPAPTSLYVCAESRQEALKVYQLHRRGQGPDGSQYYHERLRPFYFNPEIDTLNLDHNHCDYLVRPFDRIAKVMLERDKALVRYISLNIENTFLQFNGYHMAVEDMIATSAPRGFWTLIHLAGQFPNLRAVDITYDRDRLYNGKKRNNFHRLWQEIATYVVEGLRGTYVERKLAAPCFSLVAHDDHTEWKL